jgi:diacylglycerol kinase family enzyme
MAPPESAAARYIVIRNAAAGRSAMPTDADIAAAFGAGARVEVRRPARPSQLPRLARAAAAERPAAVVAAGGDGTVRAVAAAVVEGDVPLGILPQGTFNYFARDHGIPADLAEAAKIVRAGDARRVSVGTVNGHLFLNNCSFGLYRRAIEARERHKARFGRSRIVAYLSGLHTALRRHPYYEVSVEIEGAERHMATPLMFIGHNRLQLAQYGFDVSAIQRFPQLVLVRLKPVGRLALLRLALRGAFGRLAGAPELEVGEARELRVDSHRLRRRLKVAVDGEIVRCRLPLRLSIRDRALPLLAPE